MILENAEDNCIHQLRVIHLHEAKFSLLCRVFWRKLLHNTEDKKILNEGACGGRLNCNAHMPPFMDDTMNEMSCMNRKHLMKLDNDTTLCHNGMLVSIRALISRAFGMSKNATMVWAKHFMKQSMN